MFYIFVKNVQFYILFYKYVYICLVYNVRFISIIQCKPKIKIYNFHDLHLTIFPFPSDLPTSLWALATSYSLLVKVQTALLSPPPLLINVTCKINI